MKYRTALLSAMIFFRSFFAGAQEWWETDRSSTGIAPLPERESRAIVQIYSARTYGWKGNLAVHSWLAFKKENDTQYDVYEVIGYYARQGAPVIRHTRRAPDQKWFGNEPTLHFERVGDEAARMIPFIEKAVLSYPYPYSYRIYPGPNSNTFVSHVIRETPGLQASLPPHAIGKDWIGKGQPVGWSESGTGVQLSLFGLLGASVGLVDGIEVNILGMNFGVDFLRPALKLPFIGRLGFAQVPAREEPSELLPSQEKSF